MAQERRPSRVGEVLGGKYRLDALLGAGGMGEIYRAENTGLGRNVAIKLMLDEHADNADTVARFLREARAANIVRHPNVVDVLDIAQADDGTPFIVQELLDGLDLSQYVAERGGRLEPREAIQLLLPLVDAIAFAHGRGVIHRDLKPENIFLARDPTGAVTPKLLDFGISRIVSSELERVTATGTTVGTPAYMSPEQVRADGPIDARTDVWSLGVILFEIVSGTRPFQAEAAGGLFLKIVTEPAIPLHQAFPAAPRALSAIVARCLEANVARRYASAADVGRDLRAALTASAGEVCDTEPGFGPMPDEPVEARPAYAPTALGTPPQVELPSLAFLPRLAAPAPPPPVSAPQQPRAGADPYPPIDAVLGSDRPIDLASDPRGLGPVFVSPATAPVVPPGMFYLPDPALALAPRRPRPQPATESALPGLIGMGVIFGIVLTLTGLGATFLPASLPAVAWARSLDGLAPWASSGATSFAVVLGFAALVLGVRARPVSWGLLVASLGLLGDGAGFAGLVLPGLPRLTGSSSVDGIAQVAFAWSTSVVAIGMAMVMVRYAWRAWANGGAGRMRTAATGIAIATIALLCAVGIARGAS